MAHVRCVMRAVVIAVLAGFVAGLMPVALGGCAKPKPLTEAVPNSGKRGGLVKGGKGLSAEDVDAARKKVDERENSKGGK